MWNDVLKIIVELKRTPDLSVASVNAALGVELASTLDNPMARQYSGQLRGGPLREVELRERPLTGVSFLVLRANPERPVVVPYDGLRQFGPAKSLSIEPKAVPEGLTTECFAIGNKELRVGYGAETCMLEVVSVGQTIDLSK